MGQPDYRPQVTPMRRYEVAPEQRTVTGTHSSGPTCAVTGGAPAETGHLEITEISKAYGSRPAVKEVSLSVGKGELFCLLGPSGSGKSTLLNIIAGILEPDGGRIKVADRDVTHMATQKRKLGVVFQSYALFPHLTVAENVAFGLRIRRLPKGQISSQVEELLSLVRLSEKSSSLPKQLSGGEQQRVAIARALAIRPALLLLDEPFSNLDAKLRVGMQTELKRVQRETEITTIMVTHSQEEAFALGDRIGLMNSGSLIQVGSAQELYDHPVSEFAMEFIGEANVLRGPIEIAGGKKVLRVASQLLPVPSNFDDGGLVTMMIRPEWLSISSTATSSSYVSATLTDVTFRGSAWHLQLESPVGLLQALQSASAGVPPAPGTRVGIGWDPERAVLLPGLGDEVGVRP